MDHKKKTVRDLTADLIKQISLDFIVNEMTKIQLMEKYNITRNCCTDIVVRNECVKLRENYRFKVLDKTIDRCSTYQSKTMFKITKLLADHVDAIAIVKKAGQGEGKKLTGDEVKDMISILQTISKEKRLDADKPTEIRDVKVKVEFPDGYQPINPAIEVNSKETEEAEIVKPQKIKEEKKEKVEEDTEEKVISGPL